MRWFAPKSNSKFLIIILLLATLAGATGALSVERVISTPVTAAPYIVPDDDGIPATLQEAKDWIEYARWTHIWVLLFKPERPQSEKDWDSMWVVRYKKILQRLELIPRE